MKIKPQPLAMVRQPNGNYKLQSDWNLTDWACFRILPALMYLLALAIGAGAIAAALGWWSP